jgi:hypothetical protein
MKRTILQFTAFAILLAMTGAVSCQSQGAQSGGGGGGMCGGSPSATDDSQCDARCGYGTYQYQCECRADTKYEEAVRQKNGAGSTGGGAGNPNAGQGTGQ